MNLRKHLAIGAGLLLLAHSAFAAFSGDYDVANWTAPQSFFCPGSQVDVTNAPTSVAIVGDSTGCGGIIQGFQHNGAAADGTITFNYSGHSNGAEVKYDLGGPGTHFPATASGSVTLSITTGQRLQITVMPLGAPETITLSGFAFTPAGAVAPSTTASIPTLSEWGLILTSAMVGLFGFAWMRRRN